MRKLATILLSSILLVSFSFVGIGLAQRTAFSDDFETGSANEAWGLYRTGEENVVALEMAAAPAPLANGGNYVGYIQDPDYSYNGAAVILGGETSLQDYSIEGDVYCYANHPDGSAYTGLIVYADSAAGTYIKLVADFDGDQRLRLYNNKLNMTTFQYTFDHNFGAADVPGGIPAADGWHHMKVEVQTVDDSTTAFWCYFDGQILAGCPVYDTGANQMDSGQFGMFAFQMDSNDGLPGYFDNISMSPLTNTILEENFESGSPDASWGLYRAGEENVAAIEMATAPAPLANGGSYVGYIQDPDYSTMALLLF